MNSWDPETFTGKENYLGKEGKIRQRVGELRDKGFKRAATAAFLIAAGSGGLVLGLATVVSGHIEVSGPIIGTSAGLEGAGVMEAIRASAAYSQASALEGSIAKRVLERGPKPKTSSRTYTS